MYKKNFDSWNQVKKNLDQETRSVNIRAGEVRWVALGVNVGSEIDGKGVSYTRPCLILGVTGSHLALVTPLSTKLKDIPGYMPVELKGRRVSACVHQTKTVSLKRVLRRIGTVSDSRVQTVRKKFVHFYHLN